MLTQEAEYITVEEAAVKAGVSSMTVRRAVQAGKLRYRAERGATKFLRKSEVDEWARERREMRKIEGDE